MMPGVVSILGGTRDKAFQARLYTEAAIYNDLIQSDQFEDTYSTASSKSLYSLQWASTFCHQTTYTAKTDDDIWLNLPKYYAFLESQRHTDHAFGAMFWAGSPPIRYMNHKNYVSREDFKEDTYPEYMSGQLYAFPTKYV